MATASAPIRVARPALARVRRWLVPWLSVTTLLVTLELLIRGGVLLESHLPPVTAIFGALLEQIQAGTAWDRASETLQGWGLGFGIAVTTGVPLGVVIGSNRRLYRLLRLIIDFLRPIPPVAILPLAVLLWGTGLEMKVYLVAFAAVFPLLFQALYGVQDVDPVARDFARAYGLSRARQFSYVVIPSAMPYIATGLRLSATIALVVAVAQEIVVGSTGIGYALNQVRYANDMPAMYAYIIVAGFMGLVITIVFRWIESKLLHWHPSQRQEIPS